MMSVDFFILEMREGSGYNDSSEAYEFPKQYVKVFEGISPGSAVALIYEPRREGGREAFVSWGVLAGTPIPTLDGKYQVHFDGGLIPFERPVPFATGGVPAEHRLRSIERRHWGASLQGRAVRALTAENAMEILSVGCGDALAEAFSPQLGPSFGGSAEDRERTLVARLRRASGFQSRVLRAYGGTCAITGVAGVVDGPVRISGLLDVAHIRPISAGGPDVVSNAIPMMPTLHRLFDAGLFTVAPSESQRTIRFSSLLSSHMLKSARFRFELKDGTPLSLPVDRESWPHPEFLEFHRENVFRK